MSKLCIIKIVTIICLMVGIPTFLLGCNTKKSKLCPAYNIFEGIVNNITIVHNTCKICVERSRSGPGTKCKKYEDRNCDDLYYHAKSNNNNTCTLKVFYDDRKYTREYKIDEHVKWYDSKILHRCEIDYTVEAKWYSGIVFILFPVLFSIIMVILVKKDII